MSVPPPVDDSPLARLAHTLAAYDEVPRLRPRDDDWAVTATRNVYGYGVRTGLTWGDLRALHADLTACPMCMQNCGHPQQCGGALDEPQCPCPPMMQRVAYCPDCPLRAIQETT